MRAVNLVPAEQRQSGIDLAGRSGGAAPMIVVLLLGLAVLAFMYGSAKHRESTSKTELATVNAELSAAKAKADRLAPYASFIAMANQRVQDISALVEARFDWSHAFHELGRVLPRDASLTSLHGQVASGGASSPSPPAAGAAAGGAMPASATPPGSTPTFTIGGCATSQSEVALTLQRLRLIDGVTDVELQSSTKAAPAGGASSGSASSSGGACGSGGATFAATITFTGLPSAPPTNPPTGSRSQDAAGTGAAASQPRQVSSRGGGR